MFAKLPLLLAFGVAAAAPISLVTFDGAAATTHAFDELNDPVMGGQSNGTWAVGQGFGIFDGNVKIVPSLKAPGFIKASASGGNFADASAAIDGDLVLTVRTNTPLYTGFRVTIAAGAFSPKFSCAAGGSIIGSGGCYKAHFTVAAGSDFAEVRIPFNTFSDKWSSATGEQTTTCAKDKSVCPTAKALAKIQTIEVWGEGKLGHVNLEIKSISADSASLTAAAATEAATTAASTLVTFDGASGTTHSFKTLNDPVMGGQSNGTFKVAGGVGIFDGNVNIVPKLKAPGFIETWANDGHFADASSAGADGDLVLSVRSTTPSYGGFRVTFASGALSTSFSCAAGGSIIGSRGCFKAAFSVPAGGNFTDVRVPFNTFSDKWSSSTGEPTATCAKDSSVCPTAAKLAKIQAVGIWGEGKQGYLHLEIKSIRAEPASMRPTAALVLPAEVQVQAAPVRPAPQFDTCSGAVQNNLRYNISTLTSGDLTVPVTVDPRESLATAICCDNRTKVFAEPRFLFQSPFVDLYKHMNQNGTTIFYDSVCGIPLFEAPKGRSFADFQADTNEHGWPSFRPDEIIDKKNIITDKDGFTYSSCGTHLGSFLPDDKGDRWCLDTSCLAGNPAK